MTNIETLTADCILQNPVTVEVGKSKMKVSRPTLGTLIEASKYVGRLPELGTPSLEKAIPYVLAKAENCALVGDIIATLILGRKEAEKPAGGKSGRFFGLFGKKGRTQREVLAEKILNECSCEEIMLIFLALIDLQKIAFFLRLTTSLQETNLLKRTRNAE
jgi:hypothetical protein